MDIVAQSMGSRKCPICGKAFFIQDAQAWVYKRSGLYFHSWSCLREYELHPDKYKSIREHEKKGRKIGVKEQRNRLEVAQHLAEAMESGKHPVDYLRGLGYAAPVQALGDLRRFVKKHDAELYERIRSDRSRQDRPGEGRGKAQEPEEREMVAGPGDGDEDDPERDWAPWAEYAHEVGLDRKEPEKEPEAAVEYDPEPVKIEQGPKITAEEPVPVVGMMNRITKPVTFEGFPVCGVLGKFARYDTSETTKGKWLDVNLDSGDVVSMTVPEWLEFLAELFHAAEVLGIDLKGGNRNE